MQRATKCWGCFLVAGIIISLSLGCSSSADQAADTSAPETAGTEASVDVQMGEHEDASDEDVAVTLAKLADGDREAAIAQKICPVSEHALGSMGLPVKVDVKGREVFICCEGCRDMLVKEPEKFLTNLEKE